MPKNKNPKARPLLVTELEILCGGNRKLISIVLGKLDQQKKSAAQCILEGLLENSGKYLSADDQKRVKKILLLDENDLIRALRRTVKKLEPGYRELITLVQGQS